VPEFEINVYRPTIGLRQKVDAALNSTVVDQRRTLEAELLRLTQFQGAPASLTSVDVR
jgi:hypothetical protein